jgi:hypothetical protein
MGRTKGSKNKPKVQMESGASASGASASGASASEWNISQMKICCATRYAALSWYYKFGFAVASLSSFFFSGYWVDTFVLFVSQQLNVPKDAYVNTELFLIGWTGAAIFMSYFVLLFFIQSKPAFYVLQNFTSNLYLPTVVPYLLHIVCVWGYYSFCLSSLSVQSTICRHLYAEIGNNAGLLNSALHGVPAYFIAKHTTWVTRMLAQFTGVVGVQGRRSGG